ncbi:MAG: 16S rRNA (uracil(1498)-N(3))-methyltransferase [Candidatus Dormibacteria bacterium]
MPRFFVAARQVAEGRAVLSGADARHLARSLRAQRGETVVIVDDAGMEHAIRLDEITPQRVGGAVSWSRPVTGEPRLQVHVIHAIAKEGMDEAVDAMAAMGAASIRPCISQRTIVRPDGDRQARRVNHWQSVARQAAQQAGRGSVPTVHPVRSLAQSLATLPVGARILACVVNEHTTPLSAFEPVADAPLVLCIGPEGDFGAGDLGLIVAAGAAAVHLGPRVLRSRLAASIALALLLARSGDLDRPAGVPPGGPG